MHPFGWCPVIQEPPPPEVPLHFFPKKFSFPKKSPVPPNKNIGPGLLVCGTLCTCPRLHPFSFRVTFPIVFSPQHPDFGKEGHLYHVSGAPKPGDTQQRSTHISKKPDPPPLLIKKRKEKKRKYGGLPQCRCTRTVATPLNPDPPLE